MNGQLSRKSQWEGWRHVISEVRAAVSMKITIKHAEKRAKKYRKIIHFPH